MKVVPEYKVTDPRKRPSTVSPERRKPTTPAPPPPPFPTGPAVRDPDEPEHKTMTDAQIVSLRERVWRQIAERMVGAKEAARLEDAARRQHAAKRALTKKRR